MVDYYSDLEKRIEVQEEQIQSYCKEIEHLNDKLKRSSIFYKVDWVNEDELTFNFATSLTFEGACIALLGGVDQYKSDKSLEKSLKTSHIYSDFLTLKYWNIYEETFSEYYGETIVYNPAILITVDTRGYVTGYSNKNNHKLFSKARKNFKNGIT